MSKPAQIITKFHGSISADQTNLPSDQQLRRKIQYERRKLFGCSSALIRNDYEKMIQSVKTIDDESFIIGHSNDKIIIFVTIENLRRMMILSEWMADGTFSLAPNEYQQLYIFCAKAHNIWNPLVYVLMKNRTIRDYDKVWKILIDAAQDNEIDVTENHILYLDFEMAPAKSFLTHFPLGKILRCHFHMWNCILRKLKKFNLYQRYLTDVDFNNEVRELGAIAFLPPDHVTKEFYDQK